MNGRGVKSKRYEDLGLKNRWKFRYDTRRVAVLRRGFRPDNLSLTEIAVSFYCA